MIDLITKGHQHLKLKISIRDQENHIPPSQPSTLYLPITSGMQIGQEVFTNYPLLKNQSSIQSLFFYSSENKIYKIYGY